jgi:hypothetical protein
MIPRIEKDDLPQHGARREPEHQQSETQRRPRDDVEDHGAHQVDIPAI